MLHARLDEKCQVLGTCWTRSNTPYGAALPKRKQHGETRGLLLTTAISSEPQALHL